jgi:hypothetical protein
LTNVRFYFSLITMLLPVYLSATPLDENACACFVFPPCPIMKDTVHVVSTYLP